jgi:hypothetical protein
MLNIAGIAFMFWFICINIWCLIACGNQLRRLIGTEETHDRTLSPLFKGDHPRLFYMQAVGYVGMMACNVGIICLFGSFIWQFFRGTE